MSHPPPARSTRSSSASRNRSGGSVPPIARAYEPGEVIADKYELDRIIGTGGMGAVWFAKNLVLNIDVAIKLIRSDVASEEASARLLVEARSAAQLDHPSIVRIHDFGMTIQGDPYIVMEMLNGESLGAIADRRGRLAPVEAVRLLLPIVDALSLAHARGIVHRDLKPDNVILSIAASGGVIPKLVDFGIAKLGSQPNAPPASDTPLPGMGQLKSRLTNLGAVIGSPQYMAPEQAEGSADVDARADIWALCVLLYELVSGRRPFEPGDDVEDVNELMIAIMVEPPAPLTLHLEDAEELWEILRRGLEKQPEARWQDAIDLGRALAQWLMDRGERTDVTGAALPERWGSPDRISRHRGPTAEPPPPSRTAAAVIDRPDAARKAADSQGANLIRILLAVGAIGTLLLGGLLLFGTSPPLAPIAAPASEDAADAKDQEDTAGQQANASGSSAPPPTSIDAAPSVLSTLTPAAVPRGVSSQAAPEGSEAPDAGDSMSTGGASVATAAVTTASSATASSSAKSTAGAPSPPLPSHDLAIPDTPNY